MRLCLVILSVCCLPAFAFEICSARNDYLERALPDVFDELPSPLPQGCVKASHLSLAPSGYYGYCPSAEGAPARTHARPCVSTKYVGNIHSALVAVADCFGYDPRLAFATFNLESAMHLNAVGAAIDVGIGQLTRSAIEEINLNALPQAQRLASRSTKESCRKILPFMTEHTAVKEKRCGFMHLPVNPWRNLIYSVLLIQQNRKAVERYWSRLNIQLPAGVDEEYVKESLTHLAYNAGAAGGVAALAAYAELMGPRAQDRLLNFEGKDFYGFQNFLANYYPVPAGKESTRKRISKYVFYVGQAARRVEKLAGQACFDPHMFPPWEGNYPVVFAHPPDFSKAAALAEDKLVRLAYEFQNEQKGNTDCARKRARFVNDFVPRGLSVDDLTAPLDSVYRNLCLK